MVTTVVCITPPHTAGPKLGHTQQIQDYWWEWSAETDGSSTGLLPSITQFILAGPQRLPTGSSKEHRHHPDQQWLTSYMEGGLHPTGIEDYVLHGGRTTFYTEGRPRPTQMEDCYREADSFEAVLFSHFMDAVCRGWGTYMPQCTEACVLSFHYGFQGPNSGFKAWWQKLLHQFPTV